MQVILVKDVPGLGSTGEMHQVKDGYGQNFLLPRGLATLPGSKSALDLQKQAQKSTKAKEEHSNRLVELSQKFKDTVIKLNAKAGSNGQLFGSVGPAQIAAALNIPKQHITMDQPIRSVGKHRIHLRFGPELDTVVEVEIEPEA